MPTGYTAGIVDDISFTDYALGCARAFGACLDQRDESLATKPAFSKVNAYYTEAVTEAAEILDELESMNVPAQQEYGIKRISDRKKIVQDMFNKAIVLRRKYEAILDQARAWNPPSSDFDIFKKFMIEQLEESIKYDCDTEYYVRSLTELSALDPFDMYTEDLAAARKNIEYTSNKLDSEIQRVAQNNKWVADLYKSLGVDAPVV